MKMITMKTRHNHAIEHHGSLASKAKALNIVLPEEFGVPFRFFEATGGEEVLGTGETHDLTQETLAALVAEGRASVTALPGGRFQLAIVLFEGAEPILVAVGVLPSLAGAAERQGEQERLRRWALSVGDRLRLNEHLAGTRRADEERATQVTRTWEVLLGVDSAIRNLRIHKGADKNRKAILKSAQGFLGVHTVAWVPTQPGTAVLVQGKACLAPADFRLLAATIARNPECQPGKPVTWNKEQLGDGMSRFPQVVNLLAFPVSDHRPEGWLIALNKCGAAALGEAQAPSESFRRSDAATLMPFAALFELQLRGSRRYQELKELMVGLTRSLTATVDAKDSHTFGHSERVARIAVELGREMGLQEEELSDLYLAGLLHDVGKIGIRDDVLWKAGPLTPEEYDHIKQHVVIGYRILAELHPIRNLLPAVLHHHERFDGKGYPDGLAAERIPLLARILAVADAYDAMSTQRRYRNAMSPKQVEDTLTQGADTQWDRRVVEAFVRCRDNIHLIRQRGVGESLGRAIDGALRTGESRPFA